MTTKNENIKQEETSQGTLQGQFQAPFSNHGTHGNPNQCVTININCCPPSKTSYEKDCSTCEKTSIAIFLEFLVQFGKLTPGDQKIVLEMVKDSSITLAEIQRILNLKLDQGIDIIEKVKSISKAETAEPPDKLTELITLTRGLKENEFERIKTRVKAHHLFKDETETLNLFQSLHHARSMTAGDFESLSVIVKKPSDTIPANTKQELKKTCIQLRQLTIEQIEVILGMVKDSSIT